MEPSPAHKTDVVVPESPSQRDECLRDGNLAKLLERIIGFAASRLQRDVAEDLAQETLVVIHQKYAHVDRMEELIPLALQIVRFKMIALRRKSVRRGEYLQVSVDDIQVADGASDPAAAAERAETRERLIRAISQMGERCRQMFALKLEGKGFSEIQAILGAASINTVYAWDFRCRKQLLELMGGRWEKER